MTVPLLVIRKGYSLRPYDSVAEEDLLKLPDYGPFRIEVVKPRSLSFNRMYWACLRSIEAAGRGDSKDLHEATKIKTGLCHVVKVKGEFVVVPDSIAFDRMTQTEFNEWFPKAVQWWTDSGLIEWLSPDLRDKIEGREAA